jgi:hypothetical protein
MVEIDATPELRDDMPIDRVKLPTRICNAKHQTVSCRTYQDLMGPSFVVPRMSTNSQDIWPSIVGGPGREDLRSLRPRGAAAEVPKLHTVPSDRLGNAAGFSITASSARPADAEAVFIGGWPWLWLKSARCDRVFANHRASNNGATAPGCGTIAPSAS